MCGVVELPLLSELQAPKAYRGILLGRPHATECRERSAKRMARTEHPICEQAIVISLHHVSHRSANKTS